MRFSPDASPVRRNKETTMARYDEHARDALAKDFDRDGFVLLRDHFPRATLQAWRLAFEPLFAPHADAAREKGGSGNRGAGRYYVTLPFEGEFADPSIVCDDDILGIVERIAGADPVMCQLATDTPVRGSEYQDWHRDTPPLFDGVGETPSFQLAVNFPLVDVNDDNGPLETTRGTHRMSREDALAGQANGVYPAERVPMQLGDVMIRDVRGLHRGTPNLTDLPRPMVVIGYSRAWYFRPEVQIQVPRAVFAALPPRAQRLLRYSPQVDKTPRIFDESYQRFAY
jgi:ectoine hydroxylase-related dioxygenase (phytanoyl-CoA dioxygenase family)